MKRALLLGATLALAGCGGARQGHPAQPPRLPRSLAHAWAAQADAVASALAAGDGCTARNVARRLRADVTQAVDAGQVPARYRAALTAAVTALPGRITCTPPPAPPPPDHGRGKDRGKHKGEGDQG